MEGFEDLKMRGKKICEDFLKMIEYIGLDLILLTLFLTMIGWDGKNMAGVLQARIMLIMTIGGVKYTLTITTSKEKTFQITNIGAEEAGEMSTGGGIERLGNYMIRNTSPQRETLDGGMEYQTTETYLLIIWIFLLHGLDTMKIFLDFGEETELLLIGWLKGVIQDGTGNLTSTGSSFIKEKERNGGSGLFQRK